MSAIVTNLLVEANPTATEVAILHLPVGAVARVHHPGGVREYAPLLPEESWYAVIPGDKDVIGWGAVPCWYGSLAGIRNGRHRLDRDAWHDAARSLRTGGVVYVQYESCLYYGKPRWTAVDIRPVTPSRPKSDPDDNHIYCCSPDVSLCGLDISDLPERDFPDAEGCLICVALEDAPCGPGCPDWSAS